MKTDPKENELRDLLAAVETDIVAMVKSEKEKLSKAHPGEEDSSEVPADQSATSAPSDAPASPPASADAGTPPDASASAPPSDGPPASAAPGGDAPPAPGADASAGGGDPAADQSADPAALEAEYGKLPLEDLKAHYLACKSALFALMGGAQDPAAAGGEPPPPAAPDASAPPPPAAPPAAPPASPSAPPALKAELPATTEAANGGKITKSEKDVKIENLETLLAKSDKGINDLLDVVTKLVETPVRKAITSIDHIARPGSEIAPAGDVSALSKSEIKARLKKVIPDLKKSDRDLVYAYDVGTIGADKIAHLIKDVK